MSLTAIPTLRSSLPADGGTVGNTADLFLYFSEAVKAGTGTVRLYRGSGTLVETFNTSSGDGDNGGKISLNNRDVNVVLKPGSTQVRIVTDGDDEMGLDRTFDLGSSGAKPEGGLAEFSRSTVRINPGANLDVAHNYYLQIDNGAILDYSNNAYAGISDATSLNFTTGNAPPRLLQSWPADQSWFNSASNLHFHFSEDVFAGPNSGTSTFKLYKGDGTLIESFSTATGLGSSEGSIGIFGADVMINPASDLLDGQDYYLQIGTSALKDAANLNYAGINDTTTLNFKAFDFVPELAGSNFPDDELDFKTNIEVYFNEPVYPAGYGEDFISLYDSSDDSLVESFNPGTGFGDEGGSIEIDGSRISIDPGPALEAGNSYYLLFDSQALQDATSQYFAGISDTSTLEFLAIDAPPQAHGHQSR